MASGGLPEGFPRIAAARPVAAPAPPVRREHRPRTGAGLGIAAVLLLMLVVVVALGRDDGDTTALVTAAGRGTSTTGTTPPATAAPLTESTAPIATVATTAAPTAVPTTPAPTVVPTTRPPRTTSTAAATETTAAPTSEVTIPLGPGRPTVGTTFRMAPVTAPPAWASGATGESAPTLGWSVRSSVPVTIRITGPHRGQAGYEIDPRPGYFVVCPQVTTIFGPDLCTASPTGDGYTMVVSELDGTVLATRTAFLAPPG